MYTIASVESLQAYAGRLQRQSHDAALARVARSSQSRSSFRGFARRSRPSV